MPKDWWSLLTTKHPDEIEWSPNKGDNLRARRKGGKNWRYRRCKKADYALSLGYDLIERGEKDDEC